MKSPFFRSPWHGLTRSFRPDYEGLIRTLLRQGTPERVYFMELFLDGPICAGADRHFGITSHLDPRDPDYDLKAHIAIQQFLGYDYVGVPVGGLSLQYKRNEADNTVAGAPNAKRAWMEEGLGPIGSWADFEAYPWPDVTRVDLSRALRFADLLPDGMCLVGRGGHFCENLVWLFGYENLCYQLFDNRELVQAVADRVLEIERATWEALLSIDAVRIMWPSDDMGFKTGLMISPDDMRHFVLSGHREMTAMAHAAGRPCILHACGKRDDILEDLIEDVQFDAIHSFEDTIERVTESKVAYGDRMALVGGIDVDFLCRADEAAIRRRVRDTLDICQPGGGYALGSGNSVADYIPLANYLTMLDEGRLYSSY